MKPLFSILHTSARPGAWRAVYDDWMSKAVYPEKVEYVLCIDPRWGFSEDPAEYDTPFENLVVVKNTMRRCYVDGVNLAAQASSGLCLVVNADDQFAPAGWDSDLIYSVVYGREAFTNFEDAARVPWVVEVSTGTDDPRGIAEHDRGVMVMPVLSRTRYARQGFVFFPGYESMFADNDFCESARLDGIVIDARHLMFPHRHWLHKSRAFDEVDAVQNRDEAYQIGSAVLLKRRASGFPSLQVGQPVRTIALCLSGEIFHGVWLDAIMALQAHLIGLGFSVMRLRSVNNNVYLTRDDICRTLAEEPVKPDLCLWIDDDNPVFPETFDRLLAGLDGNPEVDGVSGWCWIHNEKKKGFMVSCGEWAPDFLHWNPFHPSFQYQDKLRPFDTGGFPVILMRYSALVKAGEGCFLPFLDNRLEHGLAGEDMSFFKRAASAGCKWLVDPRAKVDHIKYVGVEPVFPEEGRASVKIACMIRAKNEARWIRRTIDSVRELCGENIFVMEDGSTDDTAAIVVDAGAVLLPSPFAGMGLDEARDKDWLLQEVISRCSPDWILMPDGDEELQAGGAAKIRAACEMNPPIDCFSLRFLYLWNGVDTVRLDGVYGTMGRQSLFRADTDYRFKSMYAGENQNHVGLHVSNAPGLGGRVAPLNVFLLHYGYMHAEDRIAKYEWLMSIDSHNEAEDFYRHCVQGDIPEVPADAKLKHGGPLLLQKLPPAMVPKFDVVPGPRSNVIKAEVWA